MENFGRTLLINIDLRRKFLRCLSASTVYSLSSGYVKCGVSVIRVSGPQTKQALKSIVGSNYEPKERHAYLKSLRHPKTKEIIDKGLVIWFPGPSSFTGEDSCEFQVHGSLAVIAAMLDALSSLPGLRTAQPGEFTKRAFYGGKLDLTEVDGLADLIHAETEAQRKQALLQTSGALSRLYDNWRKRLIRCAAHLEAYIDFAEDENIENGIVVHLTKELERLIVEIRKHLDDQRKGQILRNGVRTVIIGAPNVGKSSFLNVMCQRKVSIVTELAGTTRDIIETTQNFGGYPIIFSDTAGLHKQTDDKIELEGIAKAKECVQHADLILLLTDARELIRQKVNNSEAVSRYIDDYLSQLDITTHMPGETRLQLIANKIDLISENEYIKLSNLSNTLLVSCHTQRHFEQFLRELEQVLHELCGTPMAENPRITQTRYRQQLERCIEHIEIFLTEYAPDAYPDLAIAAQKLRTAIRCIERITGHVSTDDILDVVFKDFCIGK